MANEGNIKTSILLILLKCIAVGQSNGNESFTGKLFSNYGLLNKLLHFFFFNILFIASFTTLVIRFIEKLSFLSSNFKKQFQDVVYYRNLGCLTLWYWNGDPLNIKWKVENFFNFGGCFSEIKNADILNFSWIKYFGNDFSFLIKWHIWVYYCWNYGPSNLKAELKADFWFQIGIYSRKNCPRHGSGQLPPANS